LELNDAPSSDACPACRVISKPRVPFCLDGKAEV
jgi:hypothetical protein